MTTEEKAKEFDRAIMRAKEINMNEYGHIVNHILPSFKEIEEQEKWEQILSYIPDDALTDWVKKQIEKHKETVRKMESYQEMYFDEIKQSGRVDNKIEEYNQFEMAKVHVPNGTCIRDTAKPLKIYKITHIYLNQPQLVVADSISEAIENFMESFKDNHIIQKNDITSINLYNFDVIEKTF